MSFSSSKLFLTVTILFALTANAGGWRESSTNSPDSVFPSPISGMQMRSFLVRNEPVTRQWAEIVVGTPLEQQVGGINPTAGFRLKFSVLVPNDWVKSDELTKIHTFHSGGGGRNYYRIYIKGDEWYFMSGGHHYFAPIRFGIEQHFEVRASLQRDGSGGWVEAFIDETPIGSSNPLPNQFVPRHPIKLHLRNGKVDVQPYLQIGLDTVNGMPEGVQSRVIDWSLKELIY